MAKKPLWLDGVVGSQIRDTQGEVLSVEGADISELASGKGRWNDNHGKGFFNSVGRITEAKKIFKSEDCENDRQRYYWDKVKAPFIYAKGYLYDDEDHPNAKAAAAILRNIHKTDCPLQLKASVEGGVVARGVSDPSMLARTKIHSVALTFTPANNNTLVEPLSLDKSQADEATDMLLIKSVLHLAETNVPSFRHIVRDASATKVQNNLIKLTELMKELGIEGDIHIPSKRHIIEKALEQKIVNNVHIIKQRIEELKKDDSVHLADCSCGTKLTDKNAEFIGTQKLPASMGFTHDLDLYNCPSCKSTSTVKKPHKKEEEVEKGIKSAIAGAAIAAGMAGAPSTAVAPTAPAPQMKEAVAETPKVDPKRAPASHQEAYREIAAKNPELGAIGFKESSGGLKYDHKKITDKSSMHYGHTAGGMFGMMPHAAEFILRNDKALAKKYPELAEAAKDIKTNHKQFTDRFNNDPQAAIDFATSYLNRNKKKTNNNQMLFHSWNRGLKGTWERYHDHGMDSISNDPYVRDVMQYYNQLKPNTKEIMKALTAGYGGAGGPSSNVGGSVLQTESLEDGRVSFKYITCDKCGKEQIYAKHQVKCRGCGQHLSMQQLYGVMVPKK